MQLLVPSSAKIVFPMSINRPSNIDRGQPAPGSGSTHCGGCPELERRCRTTQAGTSGGTAASPQPPAAPPPAAWVAPATVRPTTGGNVGCGTVEESPPPCPRSVHGTRPWGLTLQQTPPLTSSRGGGGGGVIHRPLAHRGVPTLVTPPHDTHTHTPRGSSGGGLGVALQVVAGAGGQ